MQQPPSLPCAGSNGIRSDTAHAAGDIQPPHESLVDELLYQLSPAQLQARSVHGQQASAMGSLLAVPMGLQQDQSSTTFTPFPAASASQFVGLQQQQQQLQLMQQMYTMPQIHFRSFATGSNSSRPDTALVDSNSLCGPGTAVGFPADFPLPAPVHAPTALTDSLLAPCAAPQQQQSGPPFSSSSDAAASMPVHSQRQLLIQQITAAAEAWQQPMGLGMQPLFTTGSAPISRSSLIQAELERLTQGLDEHSYQQAGHEMQAAVDSAGRLTRDGFVRPAPDGSGPSAVQLPHLGNDLSNSYPYQRQAVVWGQGNSDVMLLQQQQQQQQAGGCVIMDDSTTDDGYDWVAAGTFHINGLPYDREYYVCWVKGCPARCHSDPTVDGKMIVSYAGAHSHLKPVRYQGPPLQLRPRSRLITASTLLKKRNRNLDPEPQNRQLHAITDPVAGAAGAAGAAAGAAAAAAAAAAGSSMQQQSHVMQSQQQLVSVDNTMWGYQSRDGYIQQEIQKALEAGYTQHEIQTVLADYNAAQPQ